MAQTPQQRRANEAYARSEAAKRGKPTSEAKKRSGGGAGGGDRAQQKPPISRGWLYLLLFVICGGAVVELIRIMFGR